MAQFDAIGFLVADGLLRVGTLFKKGCNEPKIFHAHQMLFRSFTQQGWVNDLEIDGDRVSLKAGANKPLSGLDSKQRTAIYFNSLPHYIYLRDDIDRRCVVHVSLLGVYSNGKVLAQVWIGNDGCSNNVGVADRLEAKLTENIWNTDNSVLRMDYNKSYLITALCDTDTLLNALKGLCVGKEAISMCTTIARMDDSKTLYYCHPSERLKALGFELYFKTPQPPEELLPASVSEKLLVTSYFDALHRYTGEQS